MDRFYAAKCEVCGKMETPLRAFPIPDLPLPFGDIPFRKEHKGKMACMGCYTRACHKTREDLVKNGGR